MEDKYYKININNFNSNLLPVKQVEEKSHLLMFLLN